MTPEKHQKATHDANTPQVTCVHYGQTFFDWSWNGCGFGQLEILFNKDGDLIAHNEMMSRDSVRKLLHAWADFIADRVQLADNPDDVPPIDYDDEREQQRLEFEEW
jgi:hypothetical protein